MFIVSATYSGVDGQLCFDKENNSVAFISGGDDDWRFSPGSKYSVKIDMEKKTVEFSHRVVYCDAIHRDGAADRDTLSGFFLRFGKEGQVAEFSVPSQSHSEPSTLPWNGSTIREESRARRVIRYGTTLHGANVLISALNILASIAGGIAALSSHSESPLPQIEIVIAVVYAAFSYLCYLAVEFLVQLGILYAERNIE